MVYSRKMRADAVAVHTLPTGRGVNDNIPGLVPGHQMSDLDGVPRQPAAETVIHYARIAQIGSFPENAADAPAQPAETTMPTLDDGAEREAAAKPKRGARSIAAGLMSCLAHAAVFSLLAVTMVAVPEEPVEEAGAVVSVTMLGENEFDQLAAGDPEIVESEEVQPEELTPAEPAPVVTQPVQAAQAVAPTEAQPETPPVEPQEPMVSNEPDVLTSIVPAEPMVAQAAPVMAPAIANAQPVNTPAVAAARHEVRRDRAEVRHDRREVAVARAHGNERAVRIAKHELRHDRRDMRHDRKVMHHKIRHAYRHHHG